MDDVRYVLRRSRKNSELVQMIIALELSSLNISNYSLTLDDSYSLLKSEVTDQFTDYPFYLGSLQSAFTN